MAHLYKRLGYFSLLFLVAFVLCFMPGLLSVWQTNTRVVALVPTLSQDTMIADSGSVLKGIEGYEAGHYAEAIALWLSELSQISDAKGQAVIHSNLAQAYRQIGKLDQAILHWEQAVQFYQAEDDNVNRRLRAQLLTEQAQAYGADLQFDIRDSVEPVYRELIGLLVDHRSTNGLDSNNLSEALNILELLKLSEP